MRTFLNGILSFISESNLTDEEFAALPGGLTEDYTTAVYDALVDVLNGRSASIETLDKLRYYFLARGTSVSSGYVAASEILIGTVLE